jgi:hypothetical protein
MTPSRDSRAVSAVGGRGLPTADFAVQSPGEEERGERREERGWRIAGFVFPLSFIRHPSSFWVLRCVDFSASASPKANYKTHRNQTRSLLWPLIYA